MQGCDPKQYRNQYEEKLRAAEMEAIQDYIGESDNLVELHKEVGGEVTFSYLPSVFLAPSVLVIVPGCTSSIFWPPIHQSIPICVAQISACDSILAGMESMLGGFQVRGAVCNSAGVLMVAHATSACGDGIMATSCWEQANALVLVIH